MSWQERHKKFHMKWQEQHQDRYHFWEVSVGKKCFVLIVKLTGLKWDSHIAYYEDLSIKIFPQSKQGCILNIKRSLFLQYFDVSYRDIF